MMNNTATTTHVAPNPRNTIFVVGFSRNSSTSVNTNDFKFFFERHLKNAKVSNVIIHKGHSRRVPGQEEREPGTPFAFVIFEDESSVQAAMNLNEKLSTSSASVLSPSEDMFANVKIERVGVKNRIKNSLYVTGFRYSDTVQAELKKFLEENLLDDECGGSGAKREIEVDVYPVVMLSSDVNEQHQDKSYAFVFFPDSDTKQLALATLNGVDVGRHGTLDFRERSDEQKQRRKCQCISTPTSPTTTASTCSSASSSSGYAASKAQLSSNSSISSNNTNNTSKDTAKWSRTNTFGSSSSFKSTSTSSFNRLSQQGCI